MTKEQIAVLAGTFILASGSYFLISRKFSQMNEWIKVNIILLLSGIVCACAITPFLIPHDLSKNVFVIAVMALTTYNFYFVLNYFTAPLKIGIFLRETLTFLSILIGIILGAEIINLTGAAVFKFDDIKDTFLVAFIFNTGRLLLSYSGVLKQVYRKQSELKMIRQEESRTQEKIEMIYSRINPHFLYNSLNSIAGLAMIDGRKTHDMTIALSKLLRYSLNGSDKNFATVEEEVESVEAYFEVERIRFENNLKLEISVDDNIKEFLLPRFLLQPLVENCVKHAFNAADSADSKLILVTGNLIINKMEICIRDNGNAFPENIITGFGLKNVSDKLDLLFPEKHEMTIENHPVKQIKIIITDLKK